MSVDRRTSFGLAGCAQMDCRNLQTAVRPLARTQREKRRVGRVCVAAEQKHLGDDGEERGQCGGSLVPGGWVVVLSRCSLGVRVGSPSPKQTHRRLSRPDRSRDQTDEVGQELQDNVDEGDHPLIMPQSRVRDSMRAPRCKLLRSTAGRRRTRQGIWGRASTRRSPSLRHGSPRKISRGPVTGLRPHAATRTPGATVL